MYFSKLLLCGMQAEAIYREILSLIIYIHTMMKVSTRARAPE